MHYSWKSKERSKCLLEMRYRHHRSVRKSRERNERKNKTESHRHIHSKRIHKHTNKNRFFVCYLCVPFSLSMNVFFFSISFLLFWFHLSCVRNDVSSRICDAHGTHRVIWMKQAKLFTPCCEYISVFILVVYFFFLYGHFLLLLYIQCNQVVIVHGFMMVVILSYIYIRIWTVVFIVRFYYCCNCNCLWFRFICCYYHYISNRWRTTKYIF